MSTLRFAVVALTLSAALAAPLCLATEQALCNQLGKSLSFAEGESFAMELEKSQGAPARAGSLLAWSLPECRLAILPNGPVVTLRDLSEAEYSVVEYFSEGRLGCPDALESVINAKELSPKEAADQKEFLDGLFGEAIDTYYKWYWQGSGCTVSLAREGHSERRIGAVKVQGPRRRTEVKSIFVSSCDNCSGGSDGVCEGGPFVWERGAGGNGSDICRNKADGEFAPHRCCGK